MNTYHEMLLPCTLDEFLQHIAPEHSFTEASEGLFRPLPNVTLADNGYLTPSALLISDDKTIKVKSFPIATLVYTTRSEEEYNWVVKATLLSIERFIGGKTFGFFTPYSILYPYTKGLSILSYTSESVHIANGSLVYSSYDEQIGNYYRGDKGYISHEDFFNLGCLHIGNVETTAFRGMRVKVYDLTTAYVDFISILSAMEFKQYLLAELEKEYNEIFCAIKVKQSQY